MILPLGGRWPGGPEGVVFGGWGKAHGAAHKDDPSPGFAGPRFAVTGLLRLGYRPNPEGEGLWERGPMILPLRGRWPGGPEGVVFGGCGKAHGAAHKDDPSPGFAGPSPEGRDWWSRVAMVLPLRGRWTAEPAGRGCLRRLRKSAWGRPQRRPLPRLRRIPLRSHGPAPPWPTAKPLRGGIVGAGTDDPVPRGKADGGARWTGLSCFSLARTSEGVVLLLPRSDVRRGWLASPSLGRGAGPGRGNEKGPGLTRAFSSRPMRRGCPRRDQNL